jgi:hypothetical protein
VEFHELWKLGLATTLVCIQGHGPLSTHSVMLFAKLGIGKGGGCS